MEHEQDYAALRNLLALRKLEMPMDTEVNRFLIEFHRRQRAQLLAPKSAWARAFGWLLERTESIRFVPSLSYASGVAALAFLAYLGVSQPGSLRHADGGYKLALNMPSDATIVPISFVRDASVKTDSLDFNPAASTTGATRFVLANNRVAYDATAAF